GATYRAAVSTLQWLAADQIWKICHFDPRDLDVEDDMLLTQFEDAIIDALHEVRFMPAERDEYDEVELEQGLEAVRQKITSYARADRSLLGIITRAMNAG
ncbi:MAG: hypothetical protein ACKPKO_03255, partial [Candidatus Fonsibacter sp.]